MKKDLIGLVVLVSYQEFWIAHYPVYMLTTSAPANVMTTMTKRDNLQDLKELLYIIIVVGILLLQVGFLFHFIISQFHISYMEAQLVRPLQRYCKVMDLNPVQT